MGEGDHSYNYEIVNMVTEEIFNMVTEEWSQTTGGLNLEECGYMNVCECYKTLYCV